MQKLFKKEEYLTALSEQTLVALSNMTVVLFMEKVINQEEVVKCKSCNAFKNNPIRCSWLAHMMAKLVNMKVPYLAA